MKNIFKGIVVSLLMLVLNFSFVFAGNNTIPGISDDPSEISSPYCADGKGCGLVEGVGLVKKGIKDINTTGTIRDSVQKIVLYFLTFVTLIAVVYIIYAGFRIMMSSGEEEVIKKSKNTIMYVIIGILVTWFAWTIATFAIGIGTGGPIEVGEAVAP